MKKLFLTAALAVGLSATSGSAAVLDFLEFANNNEHGVADGTVIEFNGVNVGFSAGLRNGSTAAFAYFDHGNAGLGVCKSPREGVTFAGGLLGQGTGNDCLSASDDNVTVTESVTISFDQAFNLSGLSFTGEGHQFGNGAVPVFLQDETTGQNRSAATLRFGINGGALTEYTFGVLSTLSFGNVTSATFAFNDGVQTADQFYLASAVVNPVPVPAALPLLLAGLGGLGVMARRKRKTA